MPDLLAGKSHAVFDAYGTLLDVHSAVQRHADPIGPDAVRLSELWRVKQLEYAWVLSLTGRYESFWILTERALDFALAQHPEVDRGLRSVLLDAYARLDAFPEAQRTLERLREAGLKTAIFSNANRTMLDAAVASAGLGDWLDAVLSVDEAGVFKTAPAAYRVVLDRLRVEPSALVFCSSNRWDIAGAAAFGFASVWVNREGAPDEYPDLAPVRVVRALDEIV